MRAKFWVLATAAGIGGFLAYRKLRLVGQESHEDGRFGPGAHPLTELTEHSRQVSRRPRALSSRPVAPEERLLRLIRSHPGLLQPEIYLKLKDLDRKALQALLLRLDRAGRVRREQAKGSYRVYPV
jgi:hypothetical protein